MKFSQSVISAVRVCLLWLVSSMVALTPASAHEVQPGVMDVEISEERLIIHLDWTLEVGIADLDLTGIADTNNAANAQAYDAARALGPDALADAFHAEWPRIRNDLVVESDGDTVNLEVTDIWVADVGDVSLPRISSVTLSGDLPTGSAPVVLGWDASFGPLVVRQSRVDGGYSAFLTGGAVTEPIPRQGASDQGPVDAFLDYVGVGFNHIVPLGLDHILFVLGLFFLALRLGALLWQITAFTLAHTITLALGALDVVRIPPDIVEPLIAASIVYVGIENVLSRGLTPWRPFIVFGFGLLHGLGFASVLQDFGLSSENFAAKLVGFNIGVEIGQLTVIAVAYIAIGALFGSHAWYRRRISSPISLAIATIAAFWVLERIGLVKADGALAIFTLLTEGGLPAFETTIAAILTGTVLTALVLLTGADAVRDVSGMITSFLMFAALVATFTSGALGMSLAIMAFSVLTLRLQSMGGDDMNPNHA